MYLPTASSELSSFLIYLKKFNVQINTRTFNTLLKGFRNADNGFSMCLKMLLWMHRHDYPYDSVTLNTVIDAAVVIGNLKAAEMVSILNFVFFLIFC